MAKKETGQQETICCKLNARNLAEAGRIVRKRLIEKTGGDDFTALDLGFELPKHFLKLCGPQPTLAELTVIACKLGLSLQITHIEIVPLKDANAGREKDK